MSYVVHKKDCAISYNLVSNNGTDCNQLQFGFVLIYINYKYHLWNLF